MLEIIGVSMWWTTVLWFGFCITTVLHKTDLKEATSQCADAAGVAVLLTPFVGLLCYTFNVM